MNNISFRRLNNFTDGILQERGARIGDRILIRPMYGRKREIQLNRTKYLIKSTSSDELSLGSSEVVLPTIDNREFLFELSLIPSGEGADDQARYYLRSLRDLPFKINGSYSFSSIIERSDRVTIGYNSLEFLKNCEEEIESHDVNLDLRVVRSGLNILIEGETGTGKSTIAKRVHELSGRHGRFVHVNLSAFAEGIIESELFGHVKGAFTGALSAKSGAFLEANHGTLFLDEIDSLPLNIQTKLLLFLDNKQVRAVGSDIAKKVDVRLIFASGSSLSDLVDKKGMRRDFFYRVTSGVCKTLTPLRENPLEIVRICNQFERDNGVYIDDQLKDFYCKLAWRGNIRQLIGHLEKKLVLSAGKGLVYDEVDSLLLSDKLSDIEEEASFQTLDHVKIRHASNVYRLCRKNKKKAAKVLSITEATLRTMLSKEKEAA